ncbi:unnamed protein product [Porites evermanni]|uniref:BPTI/Kunitz inhibitor domain-containing protein n=1 Tax=Porites evermanni TaxID=104178 RepID=A0ABN8LD96_9CNID|nr:unnamed protein product [Porites evermanni]
MRTQFFPIVTFVLISLVSLCVNVSANQELCELPPVTGPCRAAFPRWYYNSTAGKCLEFTYGGCMGNANNFDTDSNCTKTCAPSVVAQKDVEADEKTVRTYLKLVKEGKSPEIPVPFLSSNRRVRRSATGLSTSINTKRDCPFK